MTPQFSITAKIIIPKIDIPLSLPICTSQQAQKRFADELVLPDGRRLDEAAIKAFSQESQAKQVKCPGF